MALITWDETFLIGVHEIDTQHFKLVSLLNDFHEAVKVGRGEKAVNKVLEDVSDYTKYHFTAEEALMDRENYPNLIAHKQEHASFVAKIQGFVAEISSGNTIALSLDTAQLLRDWLVNHILGTDMKIAEFINNR